MDQQSCDIGGALMIPRNPLCNARACLTSLELLLEGRALRSVVHGAEEEQVLNKCVLEK